jgi:hypothetical protein
MLRTHTRAECRERRGRARETREEGVAPKGGRVVVGEGNGEERSPASSITLPVDAIMALSAISATTIHKVEGREAGEQENSFLFGSVYQR